MTRRRRSGGGGSTGGGAAPRRSARPSPYVAAAGDGSAVRESRSFAASRGRGSAGSTGVGRGASAADATAGRPRPTTRGSERQGADGGAAGGGGAASRPRSLPQVRCVCLVLVPPIVFSYHCQRLHWTVRAITCHRRPTHREHTAQAIFAGGYQRRHPELRAAGRCDDAARREEKDLPPQLNSTFRTKSQPKTVSLIPTSRLYTKVRTSL